MIIIGAGTAGCILAERLSRDPGRNVVLIEAGADTPPNATPPDILDIYPTSQSNPAYYWRLESRDVHLSPHEKLGHRSIWKFRQARILGGGGSVMGMIALRGLPADYDGWRAQGCTGWGWSDVLPYFRAVERDCDFAGELHGQSGRIPIRRVLPEEWPPFLGAAAASLTALGHRKLEDLNGEQAMGFGPTPKSCSESGRVASAQGYLDESVRQRSNLTLMTATQVVEVEFEEQRAVGVRIGNAQGPVLLARDIILSAGAIHSPALLMRSGIGPASQLQALGIPLRAGLLGVGANLQNHPMLTIGVHLRRGMRQSPAVREMCSLWLRYSSGLPGCPEGDMAGNVLASLGPDPAGTTFGAVGASLYKPFSVGSVSLSSASGNKPPIIAFNLLADERDRERMIASLAHCLKVLNEPAARRAIDEVTVLNPEWVPRLYGSGLTQRLGNRFAAKALDYGWLRRRLLGPDRIDIDRAMGDRRMLEELVMEITGVAGHATGTCRMGSPHDPLTVVDSRCRVKGVERLRVVDASIMPTIVSANTNLPVQMIAERTADLIMEDLRAPGGPTRGDR